MASRGASIFFQAGSLPSSIAATSFVYVSTASSSRKPTQRWHHLGAIRYIKKYQFDTKTCARANMILYGIPGLRIVRNKNRCILSFSASYRRWWIHPWSLSRVRRLLMCLCIAPTMPGIPAIDSRKITLSSHVRSSLHVLGSKPRRRIWSKLYLQNLTIALAVWSRMPTGGFYVTCIFSKSFIA